MFLVAKKGFLTDREIKCLLNAERIPITHRKNADYSQKEFRLLTERFLYEPRKNFQ